MTRSESTSALSAPDRKLVADLLAAYANGWFPMADPATDKIDWYSPDPRAVIPFDSFHAPRSLLQRVRSGRFEMTCDRAFARVIRACAAPRTRAGLPDPSGTWINTDIVNAYTVLHRAGFAHSIEAWLTPDRSKATIPSRRRTLVGGLYGVALGAAFFGESMFSVPERGGTDASKVCLVHLVHHLRRRGYKLLDTQIANPHMKQFGCVEIPRRTYLARLKGAITPNVAWGTFDQGLTSTDLGG